MRRRIESITSVGTELLSCSNKLSNREGVDVADPHVARTSWEVSNPNYCPFHRRVGYTIEECFAFKDHLEKDIKDGIYTLSPKAINNPEKRDDNVIHLS